MSAAEKEPSAASKSAKIFFVVALYWFVSIAMVFLNKHLFSSGKATPDLPLFITWMQCLVSAALSWLCLAASSRWWPQANVQWLGIHAEAHSACSLDDLRKVLPLSFCFVGMVTFNNLCIKFVTVSFYTIVRSLTTLFSIFFVYVLLDEVTSLQAILCCVGIFIGFLVGVDQEDHVGTLNWLGLVYGVASSMFAALNGVYTSRVLPLISSSPMKLALCNNLNACALFLPLVVLRGELQTLLNTSLSETLLFWTCVSASGVLGWSVSLVTSLQILVTSPLTHNISGVAKLCIQTIIAVIWNSEMKTLLWWLSSCGVMLCTLFYSIVRYREMEENKARRQQLPLTTKPV